MDSRGLPLDWNLFPVEVRGRKCYGRQSHPTLLEVSKAIESCQGCSVGIKGSPALQDHYQVLGVGKEASVIEIKNAFIALSKKCHPDSDPSNPSLHAQFVRVNEAYKVLSKQSSRKHYDQILEAIKRNGPTSRNQSPYKRASRAHSATDTSRKEEEAYNWSTTDSTKGYWSQFPPESSYNELEKERQERNKNIVLGCTLTVLASIFLHFFVFGTLRDIRNKELDEEQKRIMDFYDKIRASARTNGDQKQIDLLIEKHEERLKKLYGREDDSKK